MNVAITAQHIVDRARRLIGKIPIPGESVMTEESRIESLSRTIPASFLLDKVNQGQSDIVHRVKAFHVIPAIQSFDGDPTTFSAAMDRPLRVFRQNGASWVRAAYRTLSREARLSEDGLAGTAEAPVYTYANGAFQVFPSGTARIYYVEIPDPIALADLGVSDDLIIPRRLEAALVFFCASESYRRLQVPALQAWAAAQYEAELAPYLIERRISARWRDSEVVVYA